MGSGRDKRKKAKEAAGAPKVSGAAKTASKTERNAQKASRRAEKAAGADEDDIDALLAQFSSLDAKQTAVEIQEDCDAPTARVNASVVAHAVKKSDHLIMFGGEFFDDKADKVYVNGDLYRYHTGRGTWSRVASPHSPPPRSAHQAAIHKQCMYVFGGEFTSPNQTKFKHLKDIWRLDLDTWEWEELPGRKGPSARSGHRMVAYKNKLIMFGGFYDCGSEMRYYNDLWEYDLDSLSWTCVGGGRGHGPSPRSGCRLLLHGDTLLLYGGYTKAADDEDPDLQHGKAHDDLWALDLTSYKWDKVKKAGLAPPPRASFGLVVHKQRGVLFGGVSDNETRGGEGLSSDFHNDLYQLNLESRRWYPLAVKTPPKPKGRSATDAGDTGSVGPVSEASRAAPIEASEGLHKAASRIQANWRGSIVRKAYKLYRVGGVVSEILYSPSAYGIDLSVLNAPKPRARINASLVVVRNTLWLWGGIVEIEDKEVTLDDLWTLDLVKLNGWVCVRENTVGEEDFKAVGGESSGDDDDDEADGARSPRMPTLLQQRG